MTIQLSRDECKDIIALQQDQRFRRFLRLLEEDANNKVERLLKYTGKSDGMYRLQGATNEIVSILDLIGTAQETLDKFDNQS